LTIQLDALRYGSAEYNAFINETKHTSQVLDSNEKRSIFEYTGWYYKDYNSYLMNPESACSDVVRNGVAILDSALSKSAGKHDFVLYHGMSANKQTQPEFMEKFWDTINNGMFSRPTYISTSVDVKVASEISGSLHDGIIFEIHTNDGLALGDDVSEMGIREKEILLPRNKKFAVTDVKKNCVVTWGVNKKSHTVIQLCEI
jgi:hypothetical protein